MSKLPPPKCLRGCGATLSEQISQADERCGFNFRLDVRSRRYIGPSPYVVLSELAASIGWADLVGLPKTLTARRTSAELQDREGCALRSIRALGGPAALAIAVALSGCAGGPSPTQAGALAQRFAQEKAKYEANVGKNFWVQMDVRLCQKPIASSPDCTIISSPTRLTLDRIDEGVVEAGDAYCHVTLDDGRAGYVGCFVLMAQTTDIDPAVAAAECKRRGNPRVGMTAKQVEASCWGKPDHVNRRQTARATTDQYVYGDGRYVHLRNGIVTSIQASGTLR